jgi:CDP-glucose 4,6-dehydratase
MDLTLGARLRELPGPIMVTGHTGFKGTWLTLLLERLGVPVVGFSLPPEKDSLFDRAKRGGAIPEVFQDIRNIDAVSNFMKKYEPSAVIHMAAQPIVLKSYETPLETFETNVMGTVNILEVAFKIKSVEAVVVTTTDKVYRNDNSGRAFVETDPLAGKDPYSASKVGTEAVISAWQQIEKTAGGPKVFSVRAGNVIGGGDWGKDRLLPDLIRGLIASGPIHIRNPESNRPWQHVLDPLHGYIMALESILESADFSSMNFGPRGHSLSVKEVIEIGVALWPNSSKVEFATNPSGNMLEAHNLRLDSRQAHEILNWKPFWSQKDAVVASVEWWDSVLNKSVAPADACQLDIELMLKRSI